jgi:plastocyanin
MSKFNKGSSMILIIITIVAVLAIAGGSYYFINKKPSTAQGSIVDKPVMVENDDVKADDSIVGVDSGSVIQEEPKAPTESIVNVTVEGGMFYFEPNIIRAKVGQTVRVLFKDVESKGTHSFVISDLNVATSQIPVGESDTVEFTPSQAGEFEFHCSVGNHKDQGMLGTLIVTD